MAEYFDNLLSVDHLFDITVYVTQRNLLLDKVFSASTSHRTDYFQNDKNKSNNDQRQPETDTQHGNKYDYNRHNRIQQLWDTLRDHLAQCIGIVGIMTHDIAMCVGIKIPDRQFLHVGKHLITDFFQNTLSDNNHKTVVQVSGYCTCKQDYCNFYQILFQTGKINLGLCQ